MLEKDFGPHPGWKRDFAFDNIRKAIEDRRISFDERRWLEQEARTRDLEDFWQSPEQERERQNRLTEYEQRLEEIQRMGRAQRKRTCEDGLHVWDIHTLLCQQCGITREVFLQAGGKVLEPAIPATPGPRRIEMEVDGP